MALIIKGGGKLVYDEDSAIEVPKDEMPVYLEWILWRAMLAIDHLLNKPYQVRGFRLDADFMPVSTAGGGRGDLYCEFDDYTILTEVTMSSSSRQEAMEGEPVRRHVSDAMSLYDKPVYGMFVAVKIDTNTAETFRHGIWYSRDNKRQNLTIVPFTLEQFLTLFVSMFRSGRTNPNEIKDLILYCKSRKDFMDAPTWKDFIQESIITRSNEMITKTHAISSQESIKIKPGQKVYHSLFGAGQVIALDYGFANKKGMRTIPYAQFIPSETSIDWNEWTMKHKDDDCFVSMIVVAFHDYILHYGKTDFIEQIKLIEDE